LRLIKNLPQKIVRQNKILVFHAFLNKGSAMCCLVHRRIKSDYEVIFLCYLSSERHKAKFRLVNVDTLVLN